MKHLSLFLVIALALPITLPAQEVRLSGTVQDAATQQPIPGANVLIEATRQGTITDLDGNFSLTVATDDNPTLAVSFIGYQTITRTIDGPTDPDDLTFSLREDVLILYGA